eukprot:9496554-Pyramimonas_sp.AAC.1
MAHDGPKTAHSTSNSAPPRWRQFGPSQIFNAGVIQQLGAAPKQDSRTRKKKQKRGSWGQGQQEENNNMIGSGPEDATRSVWVPVCRAIRRGPPRSLRRSRRGTPNGTTRSPLRRPLPRPKHRLTHE